MSAIHTFTPRPLIGFAIAVGVCAAYYGLLLWSANLLSPDSRAWWYLPLYILLGFALPMAACAFFHAQITRGKVIATPRRWLQIATSAVAAPVVAQYLVIGLVVLITGEGF